MWLSKFLEIDNLKDEVSKEIIKEFIEQSGKKKFTPLEFTILEIIFNSKLISTDDLILKLQEHFVGLWETESKTVKPILSKLKGKGFLKTEHTKTPLGPRTKVYFVTQAGKEILKAKVNENFADQFKLLKNFLIELSSMYVGLFPENEKEEKLSEVQNLLDEIMKSIKGELISKKINDVDLAVKL